MLTKSGKVYQAGISATQLKLEPSNFYSIFAEVTALKNQTFYSVKAKEFSAALTFEGKLYVFATCYQYTIIEDLVVSDFELSKDYVIIRTQDGRFLKYDYESGSLLAFEGDQKLQVNDLSILSCGHSFILGVKTKPRAEEQKNLPENASLKGPQLKSIK